jgi:predicted HTH domain antitoxin
METVRVELPSTLLEAASLEDGGNVSQAAARLPALELHPEDKVSLERAAALSQTPLAAFMEFAAQHGVAPLRYN